MLSNFTSAYWPLIAVLAIACAAYQWRGFSVRQGRSRLPLPPGPKPLPILGNIRDFPKPGMPEYRHWLTHKDLYGPITSVSALGNTMVVIHDREMALDLLERRGFASRTSGRPSLVFGGELCGYVKSVIFNKYDAALRRTRGLLHGVIGIKAVLQYQDAQEHAVGRQLARMLDSPQDLLNHYKTTAGSTILKATYGYTIEPSGQDPVVDLSSETLENFNAACVPFSWAVDFLPFLKLIPEWFPGGSFKKTANQFKQQAEMMAYTPYHFVRDRMAAGRDNDSMVAQLIHRFGDRAAHKDGSGVHRPDDLTPDEETLVVWSAASLYGAAVDTSVISLTAFTLAMLRYPDVQRKAQAEIDRVVGRGRLPTFADRADLPYVNAVVKETARWWTVLPMGFPHRADEEFEYGGYRIPKHATLVPAVWWFMHDPALHADPETFDPERFLDPARNEPDPAVSGWFGFGRRICPGRYFAEASIFINVAQTLATFNIDDAAPAAGLGSGDVEEAAPKPGIFTFMSDFRFRVSPRSAEHEELIRRVARDHPPETSDSKFLRNRG